MNLDVAQIGRASGLGPEGQWFESIRPDQNIHENPDLIEANQ